MGRDRIAVTVILMGLGIFLAGCTGLFDGGPPPDGTDGSTAATDGMELVGTWEYRSHREVNQDENAIKGQLSIETERCSASASWCEVTGQVTFPAPVPRLDDRIYDVHGRSYPDQGFVRFNYTVPHELLSDHRLRVEVTLDRMLATEEHPRAMAGYTVIFNQDRPGKEFDDWAIIDAAGRGIVESAGRVTAWPVEAE